MTIAELISSLCYIIADMTKIISKLSERLLQIGCMTEGEYEEISKIEQRIKAFGIDVDGQDK